MNAMLALKPNCECCDRDLPPSAPGAFICSFECTFCESCATGRLDLTCPNCRGALLARPTRAAALLSKFPASQQRSPIVNCDAGIATAVPRPTPVN
jgi:hypothetical protein